MSLQAEQIREQQKASWNKFSSGWKKWDAFNMEFLKPMGEAIVASLELQDTDSVLDIATGTGEPGITIAKIVSKGKVTGTDLAEDMLAIARENAQLNGISNYETQVADVSALPFEGDTFNALSCRMGFMFFPDMQLAATEMYRVLKPGGKIATSVWAAASLNNWVTTVMSVIQKNITAPPPIVGAPGMFRCAEPGFISKLFKEAGFKNITEESLAGKVNYNSFERYWEIMLDVGAPIVAALAGADEAMRAKIKSEVAELFMSRNANGGAHLEYAAIVIVAEK